jgi:hypothetical protein
MGMKVIWENKQAEESEEKFPLLRFLEGNLDEFFKSTNKS